MTTPAMKYDFNSMMAVITDVNKQLNEFTTTLEKFRTDLKELSIRWEGGASGAANALGGKLETQGQEIRATVARFVEAMKKNLEESQRIEKENARLFNA